MMKAMVHHRYGSPSVLRPEDICRPVPGEDEVLVRIRAASLNPYDRYLMRGRPYLIRLQTGLFKPKVKTLGQDLAGHVVALGPNVSKFKPGDRVFGDMPQIFSDVSRAFAEYACVPQESLVLKPSNVSFVEAAAVPMAGRTALQGLRNHGSIRGGQRVLINGSSGGVGTFAVQIAKAFDAHVTAVCSSTKVERAAAIGADRVIDYCRHDFTREAHRYDLILDVVSSQRLRACRRLLTPDGVYVFIGAPEREPWFGPVLPWLKVFAYSWLSGRKKMVASVTPQLKDDLLFLQALLQSGKVKPVIDRCYPLNQLSEAIRYLEKGHAKGKIVLEI